VGSIDVARARRETPGCASVIHLNNAGAALPPAIVVDTVVDHLHAEAMHGGYEAAAAAAGRLDEVYAAIGRLIGAAPGEIALTESATRAWDMAFYAFGFGAGDVIVTGEAEYSSNVIAFLQVARRTGASFEVIGSDPDGQIDLPALERRLRQLGARAALVALTHVPTSGGLVNPAADVGAVTKAAGVPYLLDACQSVGQLRVDVADIGCDLLSATGRKFLRAPRGTGFLYVSDAIRDRLEPPFLDLRAATWVAEDRYQMRPDARRFESWEANIAGRLGLGAAVEYALGWGMPAIEARVEGLGATTRERLAGLPGVTVADRGRRRCGIVTFAVERMPAEQLSAGLRAHGINTSVTSASSARLDLGRRGLESVVRASVHYYNTEGEIDRLVEALTEVRSAGVGAAATGESGGMTQARTPDDHIADPVQNPEEPATEDSLPTGGNAAQAAAVFGEHAEPPAEMDSGGAG
jgi:cysteine desulfurase/selenocysteine lyase